MLAFLLLIINANAGGYDQPGSKQMIEAELYMDEISSGIWTPRMSTIEFAIADGLTGISKDDIDFYNATYPHLFFRFQAGYTFAELEALKTETEGLCAAISAHGGFTAQVGATLGNDCVVNINAYSAPYGEFLNGNCSSGDYEVTGVNMGRPVMLNFSRSYFSVGEQNTSYLNLDFQVPTMYLYTDQNVTGTGGTKRYNRGMAITFHDRWNETEEGPWKTGACYTTRDNYAQCPYITEQWRYEDVDDGCSQRLQGRLPFLDLLYQEGADPDNVIVLNSTRMINGYLTPTWELYMVAFVETWSGFIQESPLAGNNLPTNSVGVNLPQTGIGGLYFNNPTDPNSTVTNWDGHLEINAERYSYYILPFTVSWPQRITIDAERPITSAARLIVLYAVITQKQLEINFTPSAGEKFGILHLTIQTQTQFPFGLRNDTDPIESARAKSTQVSGFAAGAPVFRDSDHWSTCIGTLPNEYCIQNWHMTIEPQLCDVSGTYKLEFYAECFNTTKCALDINAGTLTSNAYSGELIYSIVSEPFCPKILDEIYTQGTISKYVDPEFLVPAQENVNYFVNDHLYFEVTFLTRSREGKDHNNLDFADGDDSLIQFVRPYYIELEITMKEEPLQTTVNADNGDVVFPTPSDSKHYTIMLCEVNRMNFPYLGNHTDCFTQRGWNAINYLEFKNWTHTNGTNPIDDNEIAFSFRLDERVMPVDVPNSPIEITVSVDVEIFYHGNNNPAQADGRRRLSMTFPRRRLQDGSIQDSRVQPGRVRDRFSVIHRPDLLYCPLKPALTSAGFMIEILMNPVDIPNSAVDALSDINQMRYKIASMLNVDLTKAVEIYEVNRCADNRGCAKLYPLGRRVLSDLRYARYYIDIKDFDAAVRFQGLILTPSSELYKENGLFHDKVVRTMHIDHCVASAQIVFNEYRTQKIADDVQQTPPRIDIGESSITSFGILISLIVAALSL